MVSFDFFYSLSLYIPLLPRRLVSCVQYSVNPIELLDIINETKKKKCGMAFKCHPSFRHFCTSFHLMVYRRSPLPLLLSPMLHANADKWIRISLFIASLRELKYNFFSSRYVRCFTFPFAIDNDGEMANRTKKNSLDGTFVHNGEYDTMHAWQLSMYKIEMRQLAVSTAEKKIYDTMEGMF